MNTTVKKFAAIGIVAVLSIVGMSGCSAKKADKSPTPTVSASATASPSKSRTASPSASATTPDATTSTVVADPEATDAPTTNDQPADNPGGSNESGINTGGSNNDKNTDGSQTGGSQTGGNNGGGGKSKDNPPAQPTVPNPPAPTTQAPPPPPQPDYCPNGDYTGNAYDGSCGTKPAPQPDNCPGGDYSGNQYDGSCGKKPRAAAGVVITSCAWEPALDAWMVRGYITGEPGSTVNSDIWITTPWGEKHFPASGFYIGTSGKAVFEHGVNKANSAKNTCGGNAWY